MKKKRDGGFTLIELMIVIAVIGILAVVLIPKVGTIKTQAKSAGIETNMRTVEGFLQSRVSDWADQGVANTSIASEVYNAFTSANTENPKNPFSGLTDVNDSITTPTGATLAKTNAIQILSSTPGVPYASGQGTIAVIVPVAVTPTAPIVVIGYDINGNAVSTDNVRP